MSHEQEGERAEIEVRNLAFSYNNNIVFESLSIRVAKGKILGLVGKSGSGKTTFLQTCAGLFQPTDGQVFVSGREVLGPGLIRGVIFQEESLLGWLTVIENLLFPDHRGASAGVRSAANELLGRVGLAGKGDSYPSELSAGMKKRVEFARALLADGRYILADEPFGTLDTITRRELWGLWLKMRETDPRSGILCTHDPEEAVRLSDEVVPLVATEPARFGEIIRVPDEVKQVPLDEDKPLLRELRQMVIGSLDP